MHETSQVQSILFVLLACLTTAVLMMRLRQPTLIGYILGGIVIGPHVLGIVPYDNVAMLADLGVSLLLFTVGIELSIRKLIRVRYISIFGGIAMFALTALASYPLALELGLSPLGGLAFACTLWVSCTSVVLRLLSERAEVGSTQGNIVSGILVFQDIAVVPVLAILPILAARPEIDHAFLVGLIGKSVLYVVILFGASRFIVPKLLHAIARTKSKELFSIAILCVVAGVAAISHKLGLSLALGAFVAGLIISDSDFGEQATSDILPLKDSFGAIFFASVGMLLNPAVFVTNTPFILGGLALLIVGKFLLSFLVIFCFRYPIRVNVFVSLALAQIGEFGLLLLMLALSHKLIEDTLYQNLLVITVLSIVATPYLLKFVPFLASRLEFLDQTAWLSRRDEAAGAPAPGDSAKMAAAKRARASKQGNHVILCGFGPTGSIVMEKLLETGNGVTVVDLNYKVIQELKAEGKDAIYGDCSNKHVLEGAGIEKASLLIVTIPDPIAMRAVVANVRAEYPKLPIFVRVKYNSDRKKVLDLGATDVVWEEFEAGQELAIRTLHALRN